MKSLFISICCLCLIAGASAQFKEGYYIDSSGNHIPGLLKYTFGGNLFTDKSKGDCRLVYRSGPDAEKLKFNAKEIKGFVIGEDSFTVIYNFRISSFVHYPQDFARVIEAGPITLFQYDANGGGPNSGDIHYMLVEKDRKLFLLNGNFREVMESFTADDPELNAQIRTKKLKYKHLRDIVHSYNTFKSGQPL